MDISELAKEINRQLAEYTDEISEEIETLAQQVAKKGVKLLKQKSPKLTGDYAKGWRAKKVNGKWIVHNATNYQLTHLLEKGHAKVNGGRVEPVVHIKPVEDEIVDDFIKGVEEAIRR